MFDKFTIPKCRNCGTDATISKEDNNACGDPQCCCDYREWVYLSCPTCGQREDLDPDDV